MELYSIHLVNIVPLSGGINKNDPMHAPLGILYVGSALKRKGFNVVLHHITSEEIDGAVSQIISDHPLFVGFSVLSGLTTYYSAKMSEKIKQRSKIPILWGGHHPSLLGQQCLGETYIDFICIGEGEETAVEFAEALQDRQSPEGIRGIGYKRNGQPIIDATRGWIKDLDQLDLDWDLLDIQRYYPRVRDWYRLPPNLNERIGEKRFVTLFSSRGCPFNCGFCSTRKYSGELWRAHSVDYIMKQILKLEQRIGPVGMVAFSDDNLMVNEKRGSSILEALYEKGIIVDYVNIRIDQLKDQLIENFAKYEVHSVFFGFESGNTRLLKLMNKNISPEQILDRVRALQRFPQITLVASGILGIPTETEEEIRNDIAFALKLHSMIQNGIVSLFRFIPLPATSLTELAVKDGFKLPEHTTDWRIIDPQFEGYQMSWLPWMTPEKLRKLYLTQTLIRNYMPKVTKTMILGSVYFKAFLAINRWRLKYQNFFGLTIQWKLEQLIRQFGIRFLRPLLTDHDRGNGCAREKNGLAFNKIGLPTIKNIVKVCLRVVDLCAAIPICLCTPFVSPISQYFIRVNKKFKGEKNVLFLSGGSTLEDCYKKFGSLEPLFNYDGPIKSFNRVVLFWYPVRNNLTVTFRDDYIIHERKGIRFLPITSHLLLLLEFLFLVKRNNIHVIRAFDPYQKGLMAWAISRFTSLPWCVSLHADYEKREALQGEVIPRMFGSIKISQLIERFVYRNVNLILPIRESLAAKIKAKGGPPEKIRIFPHGIDLGDLSSSNNLDWLEGKESLRGRKIISVVSRLEKENYLTDVLSVTENLSKKRDDFVVLIAGDGSQRKSVEAEVTKRGLGDYIFLLGFIPKKCVISLRQNSYLSLCLMGGFSLIEACAAGKPVISYDVEWHYELVHDHQTGFLVQEGDIMEAMMKIDYLLDHPQAADKMGENARALVWQRHSLEVTSRMKDEAYGELLGWRGCKPSR